MKKIMILLGIMTLAVNVSFADLEENNTSNINILRSQGYSESALRIIDTIKSKNQGPTGRYKKHFSDAKETPYTALKLYVDPIQDDGHFAEHQINFTNTWNGDETEYSTRVQEVENL